jgi:hypothetical protein
LTVLFAHGVQGRAETPIPVEAFFWVAGAVVVVSFLGLALGWSTARLTDTRWWPAAPRLNRAVLHPVTIAVGRGVVLFCFLFVLVAAAFGSTRLGSNIAPLILFVVWWVGLVPVSVVFGNVWRELNPWGTLARLARIPATRERELPHWMGVWPAALLLVAWAWLELVYPAPAEPRLMAVLIAVYTAGTLAAMHRYGIERWLDSGELFTVYTGTMATLSPVEVREGRLGFRPPIVGVTRIPWAPARVAFVAALIGTVTFDGLSGSDFWATRDVTAAERLIERGIDDFTAGIIVATIGLLVTLAVIVGLYELTSHISARLAGWTRLRESARTAAAFAHSLIPIALAYFVAHYLTLFVFQSQDLIRLISDPFGTGADWFGTADHQIDFQLVSANFIWAVQVGAIVIGHVLGLALAHDRALELAPDSRLALRSQYPMLALMVFLTVCGLWSLSEGMATA